MISFCYFITFVLLLSSSLVNAGILDFGGSNDAENQFNIIKEFEMEVTNIDPILASWNYSIALDRMADATAKIDGIFHLSSSSSSCHSNRIVK